MFGVEKKSGGTEERKVVRLTPQTVEVGEGEEKGKAVALRRKRQGRRGGRVYKKAAREKSKKI